ETASRSSQKTKAQACQIPLTCLCHFLRPSRAGRASALRLGVKSPKRTAAALSWRTRSKPQAALLVCAFHLLNRIVTSEPSLPNRCRSKFNPRKFFQFSIFFISSFVFNEVDEN